jgi:hypothetical protein
MEMRGGNGRLSSRPRLRAPRPLRLKHGFESRWGHQLAVVDVFDFGFASLLRGSRSPLTRPSWSSRHLLIRRPTAWIATFCRQLCNQTSPCDIVVVAEARQKWGGAFRRSASQEDSWRVRVE